MPWACWPIQYHSGTNALANHKPQDPSRVRYPAATSLYRAFSRTSPHASPKERQCRF